MKEISYRKSSTHNIDIFLFQLLSATFCSTAAKDPGGIDRLSCMWGGRFHRPPTYTGRQNTLATLFKATHNNVNYVLLQLSVAGFFFFLT